MPIFPWPKKVLANRPDSSFLMELPPEMWDRLLQNASEDGGDVACSRLACVCRGAAEAQARRPRSDALRVSPTSKKVWEPASGHFDLVLNPGEDFEVAAGRPLRTVLLLPGVHAPFVMREGLHVFGRRLASVSSSEGTIPDISGAEHCALFSTVTAATVDGVTFTGPLTPDADAAANDEAAPAVWIRFGGMRMQTCHVTCPGGIGILIGHPDEEADRMETIPVIEDCDVFGCLDDAIRVMAATSWTIQRCRIFGNGTGLNCRYYMEPGVFEPFARCEPKLLDNRIHRNGSGESGESAVTVDGPFRTLRAVGNRIDQGFSITTASAVLVNNRISDVIVKDGCCDMDGNRVNRVLYSDGATGRVQDGVFGDVFISGGARPTFARNRVIGTTHIDGQATEGRLDHNALSAVLILNGADPVVCFNTVTAALADSPRGIVFGNTLVAAPEGEEALSDIADDE